MIGGLQAGWDEMSRGIELTAEYIPVAHARLHHYKLEMETQAYPSETQAYAMAGRLGGISNRKAKREAARRNGAKGGRPRRPDNLGAGGIPRGSIPAVR